MGFGVGVEFNKLLVCDWCGLYVFILLLCDWDVLVVRECERLCECGEEIK